VGNRIGNATTVGYGPRFLHSTGQLHKGGANNGVFLQIVDTPTDDLSIPETGETFGRIIAAQALGDYQALRERGRRVLRIDLGPNRKKGLRILLDSIG
jgi:transaldolase/glucose-6-phosphate isomerase